VSSILPIPLVASVNWTSLSLCLRHCWYDAVYSLSVVASETRFDVDLRLVLTASTATVSVPRRVRPPTTVRDADVVVRRRHRRLDSPSTSRSVWSVTRRHQVVMIDWRGQSVPHLRPATATVKRYRVLSNHYLHLPCRNEDDCSSLLYIFEMSQRAMFDSGL